MGPIGPKGPKRGRGAPHGPYGAPRAPEGAMRRPPGAGRVPQAWTAPGPDCPRAGDRSQRPPVRRKSHASVQRRPFWNTTLHVCSTNSHAYASRAHFGTRPWNFVRRILTFMPAAPILEHDPGILVDEFSRFCQPRPFWSPTSDVWSKKISRDLANLDPY